MERSMKKKERKLRKKEYSLRLSALGNYRTAPSSIVTVFASASSVAFTPTGKVM
jgi:hypothetical protein